MEEIIRMLIEKDLLVAVILGIIVILFLILFVVLLIIDNKKKNKVETFDKEDKIEILEIQKEELKDTLEEQIEKTEDSDIADVLASMRASLEERNQKEIDSFEQEQEENAIISYQELVNVCRKNKEKELLDQSKNESKEEPKVEVEKQEPIKKFKNSEFISPIYGKEKKKENSVEQFLSRNLDKKEELSYCDEMNSSIEAEFDLEELKKEMKENEDFLEELKNFRNSL